MFSTLLFFSALISYILGQVVVLTPDNFDSIVDGSKNVFVKFYAPWCGHCKSFAPELDRAGDAFKGVNEVVIAKFDADAHQDFASRFGIQGYPTLKYWKKGSTDPIDYNGGRTAEDVIKFVNDNAGTNVKIAELPSNVVVLNTQNFDEIALDSNKDVLVEFYAPWCGHCKKLAPTWEKLGNVFVNDNNIVIAKVDATENQDLASKYEVKGYPTIKFFPSGASKQAEPYEGGRNLNNFVDFINERCGTRRNEDGSLKKSAGRIVELDTLANQLYSNNFKDQSLITQMKDLCNNQFKTNKDCDHYIKYIEKKDKSYIDKERTRLQGLIKSRSVAKDKIDVFKLKYNILTGFVEGPEQLETTSGGHDHGHDHDHDHDHDHHHDEF
jgi:protein disulfide-isomerase A6